jgi:soluble P-type ATPase
MIRIEIPERGTLELEHAVFDINGTLAIDGTPVPGVAERLKQLATQLSLHALTAGTHGNMQEIERALGLPLRLIGKGEEKQRYVERLGPAQVVAFGNGRNDIGMLRVAALGVAILGREGLASPVLGVAEVVVPGPVEGIDLLLHPKRLVATLRG